MFAMVSARQPHNSGLPSELFDVVKVGIDATIDGWIGSPAGITMSCGLAGEFCARGLLERVDYIVNGEQWTHRRYRGRIVQPDDQLSGYDYFFGMRVF